MSYNLLQEGISKVDKINDWTLTLINYNHKSRPGEFTCYDVNFSSNELLKKTIIEMCSNFISLVESKGNIVLEYNGANPKDVVDTLNTDHNLINESWKALLQSIDVSDDQTKLEKIKSKAFIFTGSLTIDNNVENIYLLSRKNPIYTYKKNNVKIFNSRNNVIKEIDEPLIQFGKTFDALIYKNRIYSINNNLESIFNLEYTHKIICKNNLEIIKGASIIKDFESYRTFSLSGQHPKKFITFDSKIIENIKQKNNLNILTNELKIPYDKNTGKFDLDNEKNADIFTKAICGKTKYNMFTGGVCEVPTSTPLDLS